jgi:hypothetical protein
MKFLDGHYSSHTVINELRKPCKELPEPVDGLFFVGLEHVFAHTAFGADKVFGQFFERDIVILGGIVDPTAGYALIFLHFILP